MATGCRCDARQGSVSPGIADPQVRDYGIVIGRKDASDARSDDAHAVDRTRRSDENVVQSRARQTQAPMREAHVVTIRSRGKTGGPPGAVPKLIFRCTLWWQPHDTLNAVSSPPKGHAMSKVVAIMSISLDGYVADLDDGTSRRYFLAPEFDSSTASSARQSSLATRR
jgi:hypothetical protein